MESILDKFAKFPSIQRLTWHINDEPKHYCDGDYYKTYCLVYNKKSKMFDKIHRWEESDEHLRERLKSML